MVQYKCLKCDALLDSSSSLVGQSDVCPICGYKNVVPAPRALDHRLWWVIVGAAAGLVLIVCAVVVVWPRSEHAPEEASTAQPTPPSGQAADPLSSQHTPDDPSTTVASQSEPAPDVGDSGSGDNGLDAIERIDVQRIHGPDGVTIISAHRGITERLWVGIFDGTEIWAEYVPAKAEVGNWWYIEVEFKFQTDSSTTWTLEASKCRLICRNHPGVEYHCLGLGDPAIKAIGGSVWKGLSTSDPYCRGGTPIARCTLRPGTSFNYILFDSIGLESITAGDALRVAIIFAADVHANDELELLIDSTTQPPSQSQ